MRNNGFVKGGSRRLGKSLGAAIAALVIGGIAAWLQPASPPASQAPERSTAQPAGKAAERGSASQTDIPAGSYTLTGPVTKVADGDTVTLRARDGSHRIRLDSIDAPEDDHGSDQPGQPYAQESRRNLAAMVEGKTITAQCYERDQFGRDLCVLMLPDGRSANREQVAAGYAWAYTARRGDYLRDKAMPELQRQAREARRGMWAQGALTEPWKWRYDCWKERHCQ